MPENNQASDATKPEATDSPSAQPGSQAVDMNHTNAIVPHQISNHDKLVQTMVMVDGEWVNVNDTNDQKNVQEDMHKVNRVVTEAQKDIINAQNAADSAAKSADSAISASKVNSDAIAAQGEAISKAKNALDSVTTEIQQTAANAASDAAKIRADVAQVQSEIDANKAANSASVEALKSDVSAAKQDLADVHDRLDQAQSAIEQNQKSINADITQDRKDIASAQQANANTAKQLDTYSKQAATQGKTIKSIQDKQDSFTATLADVQGNVSQVSDKVDGLSASLKDTQGNVATVKAQADQLNATLTDHAKSIATLTASAKELSSTLEDADGRLSKVEQTAQDYSSTLADVQGDLSKVTQTATGLVTTLKDAQGNISSLQKTATSLDSELKDHDGRISKVEQTASTLTTEFSDEQGHLNRVEQTANGTQQTVADQQGQINKIKTDTDGIHETLTGQGNQIATINVTLNGLDTKYEGVSGNLNNLKSQTQWVTVTSPVDLNNVITPCHEFLKGAVTNAPNETAWWYLTVEGSEGDRVTQTVIADQSNNRYTRRLDDSWSAWVRDATQTDVTALSGQITANSTQITQNKQAIALKADQSTVNTLSGEVSQNKAQFTVQAGQISSKVSGIETSLANANSRLDSITRNGGGRNLLRNSTNNGSKFQPNFSKIDNFFVYTASTAYMKQGQQYTVHADASNGLVWSSTHDPSVESNSVVLWLVDGKSINQIISDANTGTGTTFTWNNPSGTYYLRVNTYKADNSGYVKRVMLEKGMVAHDWSPAPEDTITAIQNNSTAIDQNKNQIQSKVTSTDVNNIVDGKGYATTSTVQSLITQNAGTINESITNLDTKVKSGMENNVQLVRKSDFEDGDKGSWTVQAVVSATNPAPPAELGQSGMKVLQTNVRDAYEDDIWYSVKPDEKFDVDFWCAPSGAFISNFGLAFVDKDKNNYNWLGVGTDHSGQWKHYTGTITAPANATFAKPWFQMEKPVDDTNNTAWLAKPSIRRQNASTVSAIQSVQASVDGLQSTVANKADNSQVTQLSNLIQSKVSASDFTSKVSQLSNDINARVTKGGLISQINLEADNTLIQSGKIYLDAQSVVFGKDSEAFIPAALITNLSADYIKTGVLDASIVKVKNFSADNISGGTLSGITVKTGDKNRYFQTSKDSIYWVRDNKTSLIGTDQYINPSDGLVIADTHSVTLTTWYGATVKEDGTITNEAGNIGYPKLILDSDGKWEPDASGGSNWEGNTGKAQIGQWIADREYTNLVQGKGFVVHLDDQNKDSVFTIQKDNCVGAYFGQGEHGNQINFVTAGDDQAVNITGNFHVTGSKNSIVETKQGYLAINAYETAEYYFGDIGESNTGSTGQIVIGIDRIFNETVNTDIQYQVFVTPYSDARVWVEKRYNNRFVVKSDKPDAEFGWELKAKRKGYESNRLRRVNVDFDQANIKGDN